LCFLSNKKEVCHLKVGPGVLYSMLYIGVYAVLNLYKH